jgi:hypothetical protein
MTVLPRRSTRYISGRSRHGSCGPEQEDGNTSQPRAQEGAATTADIGRGES